MTTAPKAGHLLFYSTVEAPATLVPLLTVGEISHSPYEATAVERPIDGIVGVALPALHAEPRTTTGFSVGIVGSGTAGDAPTIGPLLRACAMAEVINPDTSVTYSPVDLMESPDTDAVILHINESGENQTTAGNRGTTVLTFPANGIPTCQFNFTGDYAQPTAVPFPAPPDFNGQSSYKLVGADTTLSIIIEEDTFDLCFESFTFTQGADVQVSALGGCPQSTEVRNMASTWSASAIRPALEDLNLWEILQERSTFDLVLTHGLPGYLFTLELTEVTLDSLGKGRINEKPSRDLSGVVIKNQFLMTFD